MKIVHIVPGFGGTFYCGNCMRDSAMVASLRKAGHDAIILPVYLPLVMNGKVIPGGPPVFYGAVSIYLKQQFPFLGKMPGWLHWITDSRPLLNMAARKAGSTRAYGLEALTESMLKGREGNQSAELDELVRYLKEQLKPDLVHLSNALLLGMAEEIRRVLEIPVVCSLQDEDVWVDAMRPDMQQYIWDLMAEKAAAVDAMIPVSRYFSGLMYERMKIRREKMHVSPIGIDISRYAYREPAVSLHRTMGFLSRLCEDNGLGIFIDAFILLKQHPAFKDLRIRLCGGNTGDDRSFIRSQIRKLEKQGLTDSLVIFREFTYPAICDFFQGLSFLSVPVLKGEAFGLYQIEALASGVPLVQPSLGAFPEIIERTGGGIVYSPNDPSTLAAAAGELLSDPERMIRYSRAGRQAVEEYYDCSRVSAGLLKIYASLI